MKKGSKLISCGTSPTARRVSRYSRTTSCPSTRDVARASARSEPRDDRDERRLPRAVRAEQPEDLAAPDVEVDAIQRDELAVPFRDSPDRDDGVHAQAM